MSLTFLAPLFLFGGLAIVIPIALHLLRRERLPRVGFSAVRFLRRASIEQIHRRRLREWVLLALRVTAILLAVAAFARPFVADPDTLGDGVTVVAVDTSFSMSAPGQLDQARAVALAAIAQAPPNHLVAVVTFDDVARVVAEPSRSRTAAVEAVRVLSPRPRSTAYRTVLTTAVRVIGDRPGRLVLVSDSQASGWTEGEGGLRGDVALEIRMVEPPDVNRAVVAIESEPAGLDVRLWQSGIANDETTLSVAVGEVELHERVVRLEPGFSSMRLPMELPPSGVVAVSVRDPVGYPADDTRYQVLGGQTVPTVLVVADSRDADLRYLTQALVPSPETRLVVTEALSPRELGQRPDVVSEAAVVVLTSTRGLGRTGRDRLNAFVRDRGGVFIVAGPQVGAAAINGLLGSERTLGVGPARAHSAPVTLVATDLRHPIMRATSELAPVIAQSRFRQTTTLTVGSGAMAMSFEDGSPALVEHLVGDGRVLVFGSDLGLAWNELPRGAAFVPWLHEVVRYLAGGRSQTREVLVGRDPTLASDTPGPIPGPDGEGRVVNVDTRESDPTALSSDAFEERARRVVAGPETGDRWESKPTDADQRLWRVVFMLLAVVLVVEGLVAGRSH